MAFLGISFDPSGIVIAPRAFDDTFPDFEQARREIAAKLGGFAPDRIVADGKLRRFSTNGRRGDDSGWYVGYDDGFPTVIYGDWRTPNDKPFTWYHRDPLEMSPAEREQLERRKAQRDAEQREREAAAGQIARERWSRAREASASHAYLMRKGVKPHGLRQEGETLLVPLYRGGELVSFQTIAPSGEKRFLKDAPSRGAYFAIGDAVGSAICICEGFATAATVREETGALTICAFNAGNLSAVAKAVREDHPDSRIVICADDDFRTDGNPGLTTARAAAEAVGGTVLVPPFDRSKGETGTDWNDYG